MASVGEKIKKARQNSGYTQSKLAEELGVSVSTIARWEHDSSSPSVEDFGRLSELLSFDFTEDSTTDSNVEYDSIKQLTMQLEDIRLELVAAQKDKEYAQKEREEAQRDKATVQKEKDIARRKVNIMLIVMIMVILLSIAFVLWMIVSLQGVSPDDPVKPATIYYYDIQEWEETE